MQVTRETDYAVRCVLYLAERPGDSAAVGDIAEAQGVPRTFTAKILQKLLRKGIVHSERGVRGGYRLARSPSRLSLLDVIEAVQGPLCLNACVVDRKSCERSARCAVHPVWVELQDQIERRLRSCSFARLARNEPGAPTRRRATSRRRA